MAPESQPESRRTVAVVVYDRVAVFEMAVPCEVFGIDRSAMGAPNYGLLICAAEPPPLRTEAGFTIDTPFDLNALSRAGTVIVPAWRDVDETPPEALLDALREAYGRGGRIASLCSGAFVLAHAGLLDGRSATGCTRAGWRSSSPGCRSIPRSCTSTRARC
ncbi:MAG TPA: DJ-1/PfpI family protein [Actinomycetota bacterium]|nr:DJ-1/PfpI family protein [Actinomycetota bacterium]